MDSGNEQASAPRVKKRVRDFVLFFSGWLLLDRVADHFNFLGHRTFWRSVLSAIIYATIMVAFKFPSKKNSSSMVG